MMYQSFGSRPAAGFPICRFPHSICSDNYCTRAAAWLCPAAKDYRNPQDQKHVQSEFLGNGKRFLQNKRISFKKGFDDAFGHCRVVQINKRGWVFLGVESWFFACSDE